MRQAGIVYVVVGMLLLGMGLGFTIDRMQPFNKLWGERKPFPNVQAVQGRVDNNTLIIYEKYYEKCQHVIISEFLHGADLIGKTEDEIRLCYNEQNGFQVTVRDNTVTLRQVIPGWCPKEHERVRIKEYQGHLAIYKGPDTDNDELQRVTRIKVDSLPRDILEQIRSGQYEFENEAILNDALENLDEYH